MLLMILVEVVSYAGIGSVFNGGPYVGPVVAKEKVNSYFRRPEFGITVSASVLTYMHSVHAVMLKPASYLI